jgi:hypothetical protein
MTESRTDQSGTDITLAEDPRLQRQEWIAERIAWVIAFVVLLAAVLGMFANGPFAQQTAAGSGGQLEVDYQRFARDGGTTSLRVQVAPEAVARDVVDIWIAREYLDAVQFQQAIIPEPASWVETSDGVVFRFQAEPGVPFQATFTVHPDDVGRQQGAMALGSDPPAGFTQFFYP